MKCIKIITYPKIISYVSSSLRTAQKVLGTMLLGNIQYILRNPDTQEWNITGHLTVR